MAAAQGTGTTLTFGTSSFSADLLSVNGSGATRDAIDTTHMGTTTGKTFIPGEIVDFGEFQAEIAFLGTQTLPTLLEAAAETISINWGGVGAGNIWSFSGFCTAFDVTSGAINERMTANITVKVSGDITIS